LFVIDTIGIPNGQIVIFLIHLADLLADCCL